MKTRKTKTAVQPKVEVKQDEAVQVVSAGLIDGKWGVKLSNGTVLDGVEEIVQSKPSYSDGYSIVVKIFVPLKKEPITAEVNAEESDKFHKSK